MQNLVRNHGVSDEVQENLNNVIQMEEPLELEDALESEQYQNQVDAIKKQIVEDQSLMVSAPNRKRLCKYAEFGQLHTVKQGVKDISYEIKGLLRRFATSFEKYMDASESLAKLDKCLARDISDLQTLCTTFEQALRSVADPRATELLTELEEDKSMSALDTCIESADSFLRELKAVAGGADRFCPAPLAARVESAMGAAVEHASAKLGSMEMSARFGAKFLGEQALQEKFDSAERAARDARLRLPPPRRKEERGGGPGGGGGGCAVVLNPVSASEADPLRVSFVLDGDQAAFDGFDGEAFVRLVEEVVGVPITIESVAFGSIRVEARAPGGLANAERLRARGARLRCARAPVRSVTISDYEIATGPMQLDERFNRTYGSRDSCPGNTFWRGPFPVDASDRGQARGFVYPCPVGWERYSLKLDSFDEYAGWPVAYHGTAALNTPMILAQGLRAAALAYCAPGEPRAYFSPCIEYAGHPRYAKPHRLAAGPLAGRWLQMVLMCRVNPAAIAQRQQETLLRADRKASRIHLAVPNTDMEWLVAPDRRDVGGTQYVSWGGRVICYGIMIRTADDPARLPQSAWWADVDRALAWPPAGA